MSETWRVTTVSETTVVDASGKDVAITCGDYETEYERMANNAKLIAAVPRMYEYIASSAANGCATAKAILGSIHGSR